MVLEPLLDLDLLLEELLGLALHPFGRALLHRLLLLDLLPGGDLLLHDGQGGLQLLVGLLDLDLSTDLGPLLQIGVESLEYEKKALGCSTSR